MPPSELAHNISKFHRHYEKEYLSERIRNRKTCLKEPQSAFDFILSYSFYQGRRDELSKKFEKNAKRVISEGVEVNDLLSRSSTRILDKQLLKKKYVQLYTLLEQGEVSKSGDRLMVVSLINYIQSKSEKNILKVLIELIKSKDVKSAHQELDSIWSIGSKIASLILRDVVYIFKLEQFINSNDYKFLQPVDTWVHNLSLRIGLIGEPKIYENEATDISNNCLELGVDPIRYNQGAWYLGTHSLEIVIQNLSKLI